MSTAADFACTTHDSRTELCPLFDCAPLGLAQFDLQGNITALNPALERILCDGSRIARASCFADLVHPQERSEGQRLFRELFEQKRDSFHLDSKTAGTNNPVRWTAWRVAGANGEPDYALALAEHASHDQEAAERFRQAEKLEAVGRLAAGVAHDFNNLLTGVLLYCDLLMASLEPGHPARKYAEEIRKAEFRLLPWCGSYSRWLDPQVPSLACFPSTRSRKACATCWFA